MLFLLLLPVAAFPATLDDSTSYASNIWNFTEEQLEGRKVFSDVNLYMQFYPWAIKNCKMQEIWYTAVYQMVNLDVFDCYFDQSVLDHREGVLRFRTTKLIKLFITINDCMNCLIFVCGMLFNIFGIVIFIYSKSYTTGINIIVVMLLITDINILIWRVGFELLIFLTWEHHGIYMVETHIVMEYYYVLTFISQVLQEFEAWLISFMSAKRSLSIYSGKPVSNSMKNNLIIVSVIFSLLVILNVPDLFFSHFSCSASPHYKYMFITYSNFELWIQFALSAVLPYSVILISNFALVSHMLISYVHHASTTSENTSNSNNVGRAIFLIFCVSTLFIALTLPFNIYRLNYDPYSTANEYSSKTYDYSLSLLQMGMYFTFKAMFNLNICVNFFFYCISAKKFRRDAKEFISSFIHMCKCRYNQ